MGFIKNRSELIDVNDQVNLTIQFKDNSGLPHDTDTYPTITLIQPNGAVYLGPTSAGIAKVGVGKYSYVFTIPYNDIYGVWNDIWVGIINGFRVEADFEFIVINTDIPRAPNSDGYIALGDEFGFNYSQAAINNINKLLKSLRARLNSSGKAKSTDGYGNTTYVTCDIFSVDMLVTFLATALWDFNQIPHFTSFTFDDNAFVDQFGEILVEGATLYALSSKALIERGREYTINDNGISFTPPTVSELLNTQYTNLLTSYRDTLKFIKNSLKPHPLGLGVFNSSNGANTAINRLRFLRARRIF